MLHLKKLQSQLIKLTSEDIILLIFNLKKVKFDNNSNSHYYYYIPQLFYLSLPAPGSLLRSPGLWHRASLWLVYLDVILQLHQGFETLSTFVTRLRLTVAVDLPHMPLDHPLVRAGVVTTLLVVTLVYLDISALFLVI